MFEDQISQPDDPFVSPDRVTSLVIEDRVYHVVHSEHDNAETIGATIKAAKKGIHMMVGVLASPDAPAYRSAVDLAQVVITLDTIIVDAYDGESYVMWRPSRGSRTVSKRQ